MESARRRTAAAGLRGEGAVPPVARPVPLRESVYTALIEMIVSGHLQRGEHLVEGELADLLGVSRQPVREALQRLHTDGWVDLKPGLGAFVHVPTDEEVDQLLAVRSVLESEAARLAAPRATEEAVARLRQLWQEGVAALDTQNVESMVAANAAFHSYVIELAGNKVLAELVARVDYRVRWYYTPIAKQRGEHSWREHAALIEAIAAGDAERAGMLMREHTDQTRQSYLHESGGSAG